MQTVVARFHHQSRDLDELEERLLDEGVRDARVTGFVVAMTFDAESHKEAAQAARRALDDIGAHRIKVIKRESAPAAEPVG